MLGGWAVAAVAMLRFNPPGHPAPLPVEDA
jgi:hypothetical protein